MRSKSEMPGLQTMALGGKEGKDDMWVLTDSSKSKELFPRMQVLLGAGPDEGKEVVPMISMTGWMGCSLLPESKSMIVVTGLVPFWGCACFFAALMSADMIVL
jgi:hypothetical protein